jgi:hypothetical protein
MGRTDQPPRRLGAGESDDDGSHSGRSSDNVVKCVRDARPDRHQSHRHTDAGQTT